MKIDSLLNAGEDEARRSTSASSRPSLPPLSTTPSSSSGPMAQGDGHGHGHGQAQGQHGYPQSAQSLTGGTPPRSQGHLSAQHSLQTPISARSPSAGMYQMQQQQQQQQQMHQYQHQHMQSAQPAQPAQPHPGQMPYGQVMTPGGHYGSSHQPGGHQPSQTPSSMHDFTPSSQHKSPMSPYAQPSRMSVPPPPLQRQSSYQSSQPSTPLGPPTTLARPPTQPTRESPRALQRRLSGASHTSHGSQGGSTQGGPQTMASPQVPYRQPHPSASMPRQPAPRPMTSETNGQRLSRGQSASVSPKTVVTGLPQRQAQAMAESIAVQQRQQQQQQQSQQDHQQHPRQQSEQYHQNYPQPQSQQQLLLQLQHQNQHQHQQHQSQPPLPTTPGASVPGDAYSARLAQHTRHPDSQPPIQRAGAGTAATAAPPAPSQLPPQGMSGDAAAAAAANLSSAPKRTLDAAGSPKLSQSTKRRRVGDVLPVWATTTKNAKPNWKSSSKASARSSHHHHLQQQQQQQQTASVNGKAKTAPSIAAPLPPAQPPPSVLAPSTAPGNSSVGPLGPWEPCFTNVIPFEAVTREISNFLWATVVKDQSTGTGDAGGIPSSLGQYEIEARLGRIIDPRTNQRISLPVRNEVVLASGLEVAFESQMTEEQHQAFNNTLNTCLADSQKGKDADRPRIPISYLHTREIDSFYELPDSEVSQLPQAMQARLRGGRARKAKVRVTKDAKTGAIMAKIIKIKLQDMHVHDPRTEFDWRISVNAEMDWDGAVTQLVSANAPDRRKDRMSYRHLAFQIDLTQVTTSPGAPKTHELEVELSSTEVRRQGLLAEQGQPNGYEDLIKAFADNIRVLSRRFGWA